MWHKLLKDPEFIKPLLALALPIAMQNLITSSLNMVDTIIIGQLGATAIAAVGLANQVFFLFNLLLFGVNSGAAIFTAQFWGQRDLKNIRRVLGVALATGMAIALLFFGLAFFIPGPVLRCFTNDPAVIAQGSRYLRIISFSYLFNAVSFCYAFILRSTGEVKLPVKVSLIAFGLNSILNYVLIYGLWGFPRLEVAGSALATLIARAVELFITLSVVYRNRMVPAARFQEMFDLSREFVKRFFQTTLPVIGNESLWSLGMVMLTVVYGHMGTDVVAAVNISSTVERVAMVLFIGMANACAVMVGNRIGAGREDLALDYAKRFAILGPVSGLLIGGLILLGMGPFLTLYHVADQVTHIARMVSTIFACSIPFRIFNLINIVGILRSGGDTKFSLFLDTAGLWLIAVPLSFIGGLVWHFPPYFVYLLATLDEFFKLSVGVWRLRSGKWINNLTHRMRQAAGELQFSEE
ncbi:putative MATE family efflux protein [Hydrogenispora ethanolica]|uniref:Putative MATE family efflux protein n=1 Tax=Hydrogenispora ethanolica TaxID=1082276 RepID=A0A4R1R9B1_HYDET|nr:MATE family efflux transporter [Hydrogenispora ethanolica]TCL62291.1 putative MATE family efflux protein [Hydrogenispora ethanolica]